MSESQQASVAGKDGFHIPSLDGIRAASFFIVFLAHAGLERLVPGYFGLTVFFFLSGYLITTLLRMEFDRTGSISLKEFYLRRVLRIFPPFYLVLALAVILTLAGVLKGPANLGGLGFQAFHLTNYYVVSAGWWDGMAPGTWVYWSLAVEEHFYLAFPLLYLFLRRYLPSRRHQALVLGALCLLVLLWRCILVFGLHAPKDRVYVASDTRVDSILFGCLLAVWGNPVLDETRVSERTWKTCWLPLGIGLLLVSLLIRRPEFEQTFRYTLQGLALVPLFIIAVRYPDWGVFRILNLGWVRFVGLLSYSLYLLHTSVLYGVHQWTAGPQLFQGVLSLGIAIGIATLIYHFVEKPCARLRKRLSQIRTGEQAATQDPRAAAVRVGAFTPTALPEGKTG